YLPVIGLKVGLCVFLRPLQARLLFLKLAVQAPLLVVTQRGGLLLQLLGYRVDFLLLLLEVLPARRVLLLKFSERLLAFAGGSDCRLNVDDADLARRAGGRALTPSERGPRRQTQTQSHLSKLHIHSISSQCRILT